MNTRTGSELSSLQQNGVLTILVLKSRWRAVAPPPSCIHSAHVGADCVIHYRWHPHFGRRVRLEDIEHKASGPVASVELRPGQVIRIPAWMLDSSVCAGMKMGSPRVSLAALADLHDLLVAQGFRRPSSGDGTVIEEKHDEAVADNAGADERAPSAEHAARHAEAPGTEPGGTRSGRRSAGRIASGSHRGSRGRGE